MVSRNPIVFLVILVFGCQGVGNHVLFASDTLVRYTSPEDVPRSALDLWNSYDPSSEPLETEIVQEWKQRGVTTRYVLFTVGTFKGQVARIAAYYTFPDTGGSHPAFVWSHGGGQRAERDRGIYFASQGYATLDINWLGRPLEEAIDKNTDWGKVDPTQGPRFYSKALRQSWKLNLEPDEHTIDSMASPRNCNWYLLSLAARRAITFLCQQEEVDAERIGFAGYSMGGMITALTAIDHRLKAVVPFVGGSGFKHVDFIGGVQGSSLKPQLRGDVELYSKTIDASAYWPHVKVPVMFLSSSNDFHSTFERVYRSMELVPHPDWRVSTNQHVNHGPGPEQWVMLNLWFDRYLKGKSVAIPRTPVSRLEESEAKHRFVVLPDQQESLVSVDIYYSHDPNSRTRFWERAEAIMKGRSYSAEIPVHAGLPTFAFAHCRYRLKQPVQLQRGQTDVYGLNSLETILLPERLEWSAMEDLSETRVVLNDLSMEMKDWSSRDGRTIATYKLQSPRIKTSAASALRVEVDPKGRELLVRLRASGKFLDHRKRQGDFVCTTSVGGDSVQRIDFTRSDFVGEAGSEIDFGRVATLEITLIDKNSRDTLALFSQEGPSFLRRIELIE